MKTINRKKPSKRESREHLPMMALVNQATNVPTRLPSLSNLIGKYPVPTKESSECSEYASKNTSQILDPELHLEHIYGCSSGEHISWDKVQLPRKSNLYLELYKRVTNNINADLNVYIDNEEFKCHLLVLQCYSKLFDGYVGVKKVILPSDKCGPSTFSFIYDWMTTGDPSYLNLNRANVLDIFTSAQFLGIDDLVEQCWAFIDNADVFSEDTAFLLYLGAKKRNITQVQEIMLPRIKKFFLTLVSSLDWLELDLDDVKTMLTSNYVAVNCEMEIFMAAVRWLKYDHRNREQYKYEVLECVRFGNIAPWQLVDIKKNPENPDFMDLSKDPKICKMIDEGISFVIIKHWYSQETNEDDLGHCYDILGLEEPLPRNWMGPDRSYTTYREFLIYLDQYRRIELLDKTRSRWTQNDKKTLREDESIPMMRKKSILAFQSSEDFLTKNKKRPSSSRKLSKL